MRRISKRKRVITAGVSIAFSIGLVMFLYFFSPHRVGIFFNEIVFLCVLIAITPSAILDYLNQRWIESIEDQMPLLVRGISESQETGINIIEALENVIENKLVRGPLAEEVQKVTVQMSWGLSFEEALRRFRNRIGSPIVNRFCALVLEASRSGGRIRKVFAATSGFMQEIREMDRETSSQMRPYIIIIYAAFFVFVFTSIILVTSFFQPLEGTPQMLSPVVLPSVGEYKDFFYRTMVISGLMGGLMAGKISGLRALGGLKHSISQLVIGYIVFFVMIPPNWMVV
ncbi:MAG: type II secretion system F family protein [Candidatus Bathyarchaeota archaeon]|nr:MAG: type II secretion system F family protein [Candidatus Bathyarchaeota archaeon]